MRLHITGYRHMARDDFNQVVAAPMVPPAEEQYVEITTKSTTSEVWSKFTKFIFVKADADCSLAFGEQPVADPDFHRLDAGETRWYGVQEGHRLAVVEVA